MSKAEDRAKEAFPLMDAEHVYDEERVIEAREYFIKGYHQAEKDLELSWEDIPKILSICENLKTSWWFMDNEQTKKIGTQVFWEEVLKRFKEMKGRDL